MHGLEVFTHHSLSHAFSTLTHISSLRDGAFRCENATHRMSSLWWTVICLVSIRGYCEMIMNSPPPSSNDIAGSNRTPCLEFILKTNKQTRTQNSHFGCEWKVPFFPLVFNTQYQFHLQNDRIVLDKSYVATFSYRGIVMALVSGWWVCFSEALWTGGPSILRPLCLISKYG